MRRAWSGWELLRTSACSIGRGQKRERTSRGCVSTQQCAAAASCGGAEAGPSHGRVAQGGRSVEGEPRLRSDLSTQLPGQGKLPPQIVEAGEAPIVGDEDQPVLDGESCEMGIWNIAVLLAVIEQEALENLVVPWSRVRDEDRLAFQPISNQTPGIAE